MVFKKSAFLGIWLLALQNLWICHASAAQAVQFAVQAETLSFEPAARAVANRLKARGYEAYIVSQAAAGGKVLHKVRFGHFMSRDEADAEAREYRRRERRDCFVVRTAMPSAGIDSAGEEVQEAAAAPKAASAPAMHDGTQEFYTVQVAAKTDMSVARALAERLRTQGYAAYILAPAPEDARPLYRVRFGQYANRQAADEAGRMYAAQQRGDFLVVLSTGARLEDSAPAVPAAPAVVGEGEPAPPSQTVYVFTVQLCVRETRESAERYAARVREKGFDPYIMRYEAPTGKTLYRVRIGRLAERAGAEALGREYEQKGGRDYLVVRTVQEAAAQEGVTAAAAQPALELPGPDMPEPAQPESGPVPVPAAASRDPDQNADNKPPPVQPADWPKKAARVYAYTGADNELNFTNDYESIPKELIGRIQYVSVFPALFVDISETENGFVLEVEGARRTVCPAGIRLPDEQRDIAVAGIRQRLISQPLRLKYSHTDENRRQLKGSLYFRTGSDVQADLLRHGLALVDEQNLPADRADAFRAAQRRARDLKAGVWDETAE